MWDNRSHPSSSPFFSRGNTFLQQLLGHLGKSNRFYYIISSFPPPHLPPQPHDWLSVVRTARLCPLAYKTDLQKWSVQQKLMYYLIYLSIVKISSGGGVGCIRCLLFLLSCYNVYCWGHSFQWLITRFNKELKPSPNLDYICVCVVLFSNYNKVCTARLTLLFSFSFQN